MDIRQTSGPPEPCVRARGEEWSLSLKTTHADCEAVRLTGSESSNRGVRRTLLLPFDRIVPVGGPGRVRTVSGRQWLRHVGRSLGGAQPFGGIPAAVQADIRLMSFQLEPALAMLRHGRLRLLIADEVGLGKTIQAGLILAQLATDIPAFRAIVLTPAGVREQWQHELSARFALAATIADAAWLAARAYDLPPEVNPWSLPGVYIASLDLVKRPEVLRSLEEVTWDVAIVDEAHGAGPATARLVAAHAIACRARRIVLLTATPPDGDAAHFAALAGLGRLATDEPLTEFRRTRADAGVAARRKSFLLPVRLSVPERRMHRMLERYTALVWSEAGARHDARARLAAVILRKRALSSAASLALSVRRRLALLGAQPVREGQQLLLPLHDEDPLEDEVSDRVIGASGLSNVALERAWLEELAGVADQAARAESKLALLARLLARTAEPAIVFTEYRDTLARLADALAPLRPAVLLHGEMTPRERAAAQRAFNASGGLLLATDAASEGLNLHERCRLVVHFELPWTPARLEQRTGRVDRLGQTRPVHEVLLVARDTCERLVLAPLVRRAHASATHGDRGSRVAALTESAVAAAVMEGAPCPAPPPPRELRGPVLEIGHESAAEAGRLAFVRRLARRWETAPRGTAPADLAITATAHGPAQSALLVVEVTLERADGRRVHTELVPVALDISAGRLPRRSSALARMASELIRSCAPPVLGAVQAQRGATLEIISTWYGAAVEAAARRERDIAAASPPAARELVQVGLFDRRAARALAYRRRAGSLALLDADERLNDLAAGGSLRTRMALVALRFGGDALP